LGLKRWWVLALGALLSAPAFALARQGTPAQGSDTSATAPATDKPAASTKPATRKPAPAKSSTTPGKSTTST